MKDKKFILLTSIIFVTLLLLSLTVYLFFKDKKGEDESNLIVYGVVVEKGSNYLLVEGVDNEHYYVTFSNNEIDTGTFVSVSYANKKDKESGRGIVEVVLGNDEVSIVDDITTTSPLKYDEDEKLTTTTTTSSYKKNTTQMSSTKVIDATTQFRYTTKFNEDDIVTYAENSYNEIKGDKKVLDSAKETFISLVDFIFYDGEIKGKKFNELTSSAKAKVVYYTLLIDAGIDSKWPNYKDNIQSKYNNIRDKLIAKYMDLTTTICESSNDNCAQAKSDFKLLKESVKLTWNTLKNAFSYAFNRGKDSLVEWYEIFSGKR